MKFLELSDEKLKQIFPDYYGTSLVEKLDRYLDFIEKDPNLVKKIGDLVLPRVNLSPCVTSGLKVVAVIGREVAEKLEDFDTPFYPKNTYATTPFSNSPSIESKRFTFPPSVTSLTLGKFAEFACLIKNIIDAGGREEYLKACLFKHDAFSP